MAFDHLLESKRGAQDTHISPWVCVAACVYVSLLFTPLPLRTADACPYCQQEITAGAYRARAERTHVGLVAGFAQKKKNQPRCPRSSTRGCRAAPTRYLFCVAPQGSEASLTILQAKPLWKCSVRLGGAGCLVVLTLSRRHCTRGVSRASSGGQDQGDRCRHCQRRVPALHEGS